MKHFKLAEKQAAMKAAAEEFASGVPIDEVMQRHGVSYSSVYNALKRYDIKYKYTYGRTTFFNEDFFQTIDTEEKAYWLGFIFADGCISKSDSVVSSENRITLALSVKDEQHLEAFAKAINMPTEKIRHVFPKHSYSGSEMLYLYCNSIKMANDLKTLGYSPHKASHVEMPDIHEDFIRHFIRGYFDGDGCVSGKALKSRQKGS